MKNIGSTDKIVRIVLALVFFNLFFILQGNLKFIGLIGFVPLLPALTGVCPLYIPFKINTNNAGKLK